MTPEQLLTLAETAKRFGCKKATFYRYRAKFTALGLQPVRFGKKGVRYREASVNDCISNMAKQGS